MRGNVTVHETDDEFQKWLDEKLAEQNRSQVTMATVPRGDDQEYECRSTRQRLRVAQRCTGTAWITGTPTATTTSIPHRRIS